MGRHPLFSVQQAADMGRKGSRGGRRQWAAAWKNWFAVMTIRDGSDGKEKADGSRGYRLGLQLLGFEVQ